ncbi:MAG: LytR/AlgR family response regulator transcription factor [Candidatus Cyclobacteriaceae bacterium M2_1C_046]
MFRAIIIDDEEPAREIIKSFLKTNEDIDVVAECKNGFEGIKAITELKPDIVFLDIQMPKLTGFEMLELLEEKPVIVFSTAYDEYAIKAFELNAADYLLKPFSFQRFNNALQKAIDNLQNENHKLVNNKIEEHLKKQNKLERIAVRSGPDITIIPLHKISHIEAQDDYVAIYTDGKKYLKQYTVKFLENALPSGEFIRIHRSYIVRLEQIKKLEAYSKDSHIAVLLDGKTQLPVSRTGYQKLKEVLGL